MSGTLPPPYPRKVSKGMSNPSLTYFVVWDKVHELYGEEPPQLIVDRLNVELGGILGKYEEGGDPPQLRPIPAVRHRLKQLSGLAGGTHDEPLAVFYRASDDAATCGLFLPHFFKRMEELNVHSLQAVNSVMPVRAIISLERCRSGSTKVWKRPVISPF